MAMTSERMRVAAATGTVRPRRRAGEHRVGLGKLLGILAQSLPASAQPHALRHAFDAFLLEQLPLRNAHLRDNPSRAISRAHAVTSSGDFVGFPVLTPDPARKASLELRLEPGCRLDGWDMDLLQSAASLGALILELERLSRRVARGSGSRLERADGAAPLIGSSPAMRALRERIERVAGTGFTILIEGPIGP